VFPIAQCILLPTLKLIEDGGMNFNPINQNLQKKKTKFRLAGTVRIVQYPCKKCAGSQQIENYKNLIKSAQSQLCAGRE
jgi:hypothetical protein